MLQILFINKDNELKLYLESDVDIVTIDVKMLKKNLNNFTRYFLHIIYHWFYYIV